MCQAENSGSAKPTVFIDNERTRVTEWRFPSKGDNTGWHTHEFDYVVVPLFDGQLRIILDSGETIIADLQNGVPYYRELGVKHDVINHNEFECAFVEIEFLEQRKS